MYRSLTTIVTVMVGLLFFAPSALAQDDSPKAENAEKVASANDFATLDANGDSYLDADELGEWVDDIGVFSRWDVDADSELDADEMNEVVFRFMDTDDDDVVVLSEWETAADGWFTDLDADPDFADWDVNGDSELDIDEVREGLEASNAFWTWSGDDYVLNEVEFTDFGFDVLDDDEDEFIDTGELEDAGFFDV